MATEPTSPEPQAVPAAQPPPSEPQAVNSAEPAAVPAAAEPSAAAVPADTAAASQTTPPAEAAAPEQPRNTFDQAELDALAAQLAEAEGAAKARTSAAGADPIAAVQAQVQDLAAEVAAALHEEQAPAADNPSAADVVVIGETRVAVSPADAVGFAPPELGTAAQPASGTSINMLDDVQLDVKVELGRTSMFIEEVLKLRGGSVVELEKLAGDPVDIYVNDRLIARGEVLVLNDNFCVRINDIHSPIPELDNA